MAVDYRALSVAHKDAQVKEAAVIQAAISELWDRTIDPSDLAGSFEKFRTSALPLVIKGSVTSQSVAQEYYSRLMKANGLPLSVTMPVELPNPAAIRASLAASADLRFAAFQIAQGGDPVAILEKAKGKTLRSVKRQTINAGRKRLIAISKADPNVRGWARQSDGAPCAFCAMLVGRGPVYSAESSDFKAHDGCGCTPRLVLYTDSDGGWSPEAQRYKALYKDGDLLSVTPAFRKAVAEAKAAGMSKVDYMAAQRALARAAAEPVEDLRLAGLKKKWLGKPPPVPPVKPTPPPVYGEAAFDDWLDGVRTRFSDYAAATGNPKNRIEDSLNWPLVRRVIDDHDKGSLDELLRLQYVDQRLYDDALLAMKRADEIAPGPAADAYAKALRGYKNRQTRYARYLDEWREVNGVESGPQGIVGARTFTSNDEAVRWANSSLYVATGKERDAIQRYTGSSYQSWNKALRDNAGAKDYPDGWADDTRIADDAFQPLPEDLIVHRGTYFNEYLHPTSGDRHQYMPPPDPRELIGSVQTQWAYSSTSVGTNAAFSSNPVQIRIRVPQGHGVTWAEPYSNFAGERELILERGTNFFIHDVRKDSFDNWIVEAEVIPKGINPDTWKGLPPRPSTAA